MNERDLRRQPVLSGGQVIAVIVAVLFATAVVPPLAAWKLNQSRIEGSAIEARNIAAYLQAHRDAVADMSLRAGVVCGSGRVPKPRSGDDPWVKAPLMVPELFGPSHPTDSWGQCYLVNVGALRQQGVVLVLSAGPNGFIDTPITSRGPALDDIGERVW